jgi:tetratricopeptide (TPR) repeat protein
VGAKVIYEDDDIQLFHVAGEKPVALVIFAEFGAINNGKSFPGMKFCKDAGIEGYGFVAKGISMYPPASVLKAIGSGAINPGKPIVTYGGGSGSSPALIYAGALNAAGAIATAPMYAIDPELIPEDKRFMVRYVPDLHQGRKVELTGMAGNIVLVFDPTQKGEAYHARLVGQDYTGDRLQNIPVHNIGHQIFPNFNDRQLLLALINYAANGGDSREIFRFTKNIKKTKHFYGCTLAGKLIRHHKPRIALGVLDAVLRNAGGVHVLAHRVRRAEIAFDAYMALAMPAMAVAQIEDAITLRPRDPRLLDKLARALQADGKTDSAVRAWEAALQNASDNLPLQKRLAAALDRARKTSREPMALPDHNTRAHVAAA